MASYLVTGTTGFLGQHLCRRLVQAQAQVRALVRTPHAELAKLGVEQVTGDVVACIVRDTAKSAGMAAKSPDADAVTVRKAERAAAYLETRGFEFAP